MNKAREFLEKCGHMLESGAQGKEVPFASPEELHIELTYRCNTSCIMCNLRHLDKPGQELSVEQWIDTVRSSKLLKGVRFIVLSGGEAWLKEGLTELVAFLRTEYPLINILILSNLIDSGLALGNLDKINSSVGMANISLGSSLDGIGVVHDKIRGKKGSFDLLSGTLKQIKLKYPGLYFSLNFTLTPENCGQMLPVYDWCSENGYHVSFQVMVQKAETREFSWSKEAIETVRAQIDTLIDRIINRYAPGLKDYPVLITNEGLFSLLLSIHYIEKYIVEQKRYFPGCPCGYKYAMLDPYGNLYFCPVHKGLVAGNVKQEGVDALWVSQKSASVREFFDKKTCHCWLTCTNGYMLGDAIKEGKGRLLKEYFVKNG